MVKIIKDYACGVTILEGIDSTREKCVIVSPYVQLWDRARAALDRARRRGVKITAFIRDGENESDKVKINEIYDDFSKLGIELHLVKNLHAKIYAFDTAAILSSMNLYDYSQQNGIEISVLIEEPELLTDIDLFITEHIKQNSRPFNGSRSKPVHQPINYASTNTSAGSRDNSKEFKTAAQSIKGMFGNIASSIYEAISKVGSDSGFCIRCGCRVENDPYYPLCDDCYRGWAKYKNYTYVEKYCLACGKPSKTSYSKPYCNKCFKEQF